MEFADFNVPPISGFDDDSTADDYFVQDMTTIEERSSDFNNDGQSECSGGYESMFATESPNENGRMYNIRKSISTGNMIFAQEDERRIDESIKIASKKLFKCDSSSDLRKTQNRKFTSSAEIVNNFWTNPNSRFYSKPKTTKLVPTKPKSPTLCTKNRRRPVTVLSKDQQEEQEMIEAQKHMPKANPLNRKIFLPPPTVPPKKNNNTVVMPFKLSESNIKNKKTVSTESVDSYQFHARPIPQSVIMGPQLTVPFKPRTLLPRNKNKPAPKKPVTATSAEVPLKKTVLKPFSFDKRDNILKHRKEMEIKKLIENEKKMREFKATTIPPAVLKASCSSKSSMKSCKSDNALNHCITQFKASEAKVLKKEPFIPKKGLCKITNIEEFHMYSDIRARERAAYDKKLQEIQEKRKQERLMREKEEIEHEQRERQRLRKEMEFRAQPIRYLQEHQINHTERQVTTKIAAKSPMKRSTVNKENEAQ